MSLAQIADDGFSLGIYHYPQPPLDYWLDHVRGFESAGWDSCWLPDHLKGEEPLSIWDPDLVDLAAYMESPHAFFDTVSMLGYIAGITDEIQLGVGVAEPFRRHPVVLAQAMQTIHHLSGGRMLFGLGAGSRIMTEPYGIEYRKPASRLEEALRIIRRAWETDQNETFDFDGDVWQLEDAIFALPPVRADDAPPYPEILLGANGPRTCSIAGQYADGWIPSFLAPSVYREYWGMVEEAATGAGRSPGDLTRGLTTAAVLAETREEAAELLDSLLIRIQSIALPPQAFEAVGHEHPIGVGQATFNPTRYDRSEAIELAESMPLEVLKDSYLWGTPADIVSSIEAYRDLGVEHLILGNMTPLADVERTARSFELLEAVREAVQS